MTNLLKRWAARIFYQDREYEHLSRIASLTQRNNDAADELRTLRAQVETLRVERDQAIQSERQATQKIADLFAYRFLGTAIFDKESFRQAVDTRTEKDKEEWKSAQVPRASEIYKRERDKFLSEYEVHGVEPVFNDDEPDNGDKGVGVQ